MRIKTRLKIITTSSFLVILLIASVLFFFALRLSKVTEKDAAADLIAKGMAELEILTYDYLMHKEKRSKEQWHIKYDSMESVLKLTEFNKPYEQAIVERIHNNLEKIKTIFNRLIAGYENREYLSNEQKIVSVRLEERLISRMLLELREMVSNTFLLVAGIHSELMTIERLETFLIIVLSFTVFFVIAIISLNVSTAIARPIAELEKGAEILGAGNLDYKIASDANDEIGELSHSFDKMTLKLKDSRAVLEQEIGDRKKAEEKLLLVQASIDNSDESIFWITEDGRFVSVNKAACKNLGYSEQELLAMTVSDIDPNFPKEKWSEHWNELKRLGSMTFETLHKNKSGKIYPVEVKISFIKFGDIEYNFAFARDITERKKTEEQIKASLNEKEMLLKEVHHRVKNNMAVVSSLLNLQANKVEDEHYRAMFNDSISRIKTMALIHEKLYRSEDLAKVNFSEYINDMADTMYRSYRLSSSKVRLKKDIKEISLRIDAAIPCGLIVNELLSNSLKHAFPEGREGEIKVSLREKDKEEVELIISDNGVGFPQDLDFRNTSSLGMTLINALAGQLQAKIVLNREKGTEFIITFRG